MEVLKHSENSLSINELEKEAQKISDLVLAKLIRSSDFRKKASTSLWFRPSLNFDESRTFLFMMGGQQYEFMKSVVENFEQLKICKYEELYDFPAEGFQMYRIWKYREKADLKSPFPHRGEIESVGINYINNLLEEGLLPGQNTSEAISNIHEFLERIDLKTKK